MNLWNAVFLYCTISLFAMSTTVRISQIGTAAGAPGNAAGAAGNAIGAAGNPVGAAGNAVGAARNAAGTAGNAVGRPAGAAGNVANALAGTAGNAANALAGAGLRGQRGKSTLNPNKSNKKKHSFEKHQKILRYYRIIGVNKKVPTIGVLCGPQPIDTHMKVRQAKCDHHTINWLYQSGAEVVPILPWLKDHELDHVLSKVHGILLPSGSRKLELKHSYEQFGKLLFNKVKELNDKGVYTPLLGLGQGFELLQIIVAGTEKILQPFKGTNGIMLPEFIWKNPNDHKLFSLFDKTDIFNFKFRRTTGHYHSLGVSPFQYKNNKNLKAFFKITSYGVDANGKVFISGIEAKKYPFFGVHFQPEVLPWNRRKRANVINSTEGVRISQKIGNYFIQESRKNPNFLVTKKEFKALGGFDIRSKDIVNRWDNHYWFFNAPGFGLKKGQILKDYFNPPASLNPNNLRKKKINKLANALNKLTNNVEPPSKLLPRSKRPEVLNSLPPINRNIASNARNAPSRAGGVASNAAGAARNPASRAVGAASNAVSGLPGAASGLAGAAPS